MSHYRLCSFPFRNSELEIIGSSSCPHSLAAVLYLVWRVAVVGPYVGSYGFVTAPGDRLEMVATLPYRVGRLFAVAGTPAWMTLAILIVASLLLTAVVRPGSRILILIGFATALLPIVPVATHLEARWAFVPWMLAASSVAFLAYRPNRRSTAASIVIMVVAAIANRTEWSSMFRRFTRMSDEDRVFVRLEARDIMRKPLTLPVTLDQLKQAFGGKGRAFYDDLPLCSQGMDIDRVFEYDESSRQVRDVGKGVITAACSKIRIMPLTARFTFDEPGSFFWQFGPYRTGAYAIIVGNGTQAYDVPWAGGFRSPAMAGLSLRVRYVSPAGWSTYSPDFYLDMRKRQPIVFRRPNA